MDHTLTIEDIIREVEKHHRVPDKKLIYSAYEYAADKHKNQEPRMTGESYMMHLLRVTYRIASWGFESDSVCAALLHDTLEDTDTTYSDLEHRFGKHIADMVDAVTEIQKDLRDKTDLSKEQIVKLSDDRLKEKMNEKALFIKTADRLDNLNTIYPFSEMKQIAKAKHTREIIIPMLKKEEAYLLVDSLENLCLKIEHPKRYSEITDALEDLRIKNTYTITRTLNLFSEVFSSSRKYDSPEYRAALGSIVDFKISQRSAVSVYRQINSQAENLSVDIPRLLSKKNLALYDLTLIISNDFYSPIDAFFKLYSGFLEDKEITILDFNTTTYRDSKYYVISDRMDNLYRLFVKSETEYMRYQLGHMVDTEDIRDFGTAIDGKKIKVYRKDHTAMYIENGATFLDFAFAIHSEIGLHFDYALIDGSQTRHHAYERINEGDIITIVPNPRKCPELFWFKHVNTEKAKDHLIRYYSALLVKLSHLTFQ